MNMLDKWMEALNRVPLPKSVRCSLVLTRMLTDSVPYIHNPCTRHIASKWAVPTNGYVFGYACVTCSHSTQSGHIDMDYCCESISIPTAASVVFCKLRRSRTRISVLPPPVSFPCLSLTASLSSPCRLCREIPMLDLSQMLVLRVCPPPLSLPLFWSWSQPPLLPHMPSSLELQRGKHHVYPTALC